VGKQAITDRADWPFIQNGAVTLFRTRRVLDESIRKMKACEYSIKDVSCRTDASLVDSLAKALRWREQFGYEPESLNLDALNDALSGVPAVDDPRVVLVLDRFSGFQKRHPELAFGVLDMIESNSRDHLLFGRRLLAFVHTTNSDTHIEGLGGRSANWNNKEWFRQSRG